MFEGNSMRSLKSVLFIVLFLTALCSARVSLPAIISDDMVLQRDKNITIWGWADAGEKVRVEFLNQSRKTTADSAGNWQVKYDTITDVRADFDDPEALITYPVDGNTYGTVLLETISGTCYDPYPGTLKEIWLQIRGISGSEITEAADVTDAALVLMGLNCGFGNTDIGTLKLKDVDLGLGIVCHPRPKTGVERDFMLWPETVQILKEYLANHRGKPRHKGCTV